MLTAHTSNQLTAPQREVLTRESEGLVAPLATAVPAYRGWLDGAHVTVRAELRVANYLATSRTRAWTEPSARIVMRSRP